ncbi:hypothetical protein AAZX31_12G025800 [Glycine max]|uniref:TMV resistance protein N isoform X2 n=1 Tax=Glycine max TaxID=3847 RepID=UPI0007192E06|nr:TMV resistance protein N isoform X2 [Glycine max]KAG4385092.1 hypothetical protein GLYMA_12G027100v4 [Glycine max]|eukprot:XP_014619916.1 TMV resistance protein N isoform X2 [Glycine max]
MCKKGIHGTGGIGKTTLVKALYDSIYKQFQGSCFLSNFRENSSQIQGIKHLQEGHLSEILEGSKILLKNIEKGIGTITSRLRLKRVVIVVDDVDDIEELKKLAEELDRFGPGSRIIITTRNKYLLDVGQVEKKYEVKMLNDQESLELFCQSAFRKSCPETNYEDLSNRAIRCCKGLPLALKVLGSHMVGKDLGGWKDALDRYGKSQHEGVQKVLRISYDSLPFNEKNIFLDIACFFNGWKLEYVKSVLDACDFSSGDGITTLVNKSLLTVDNECLGMHDLIQEMGREIVKEEAGDVVGECSRLWHHEDVFQVLVNDTGSSKIQGIMLDPPLREEIECTDIVFKKMKNLRILIVRQTIFSCEPCYLPNNLRVLEWTEYPSQSFPSDFYPSKLVRFNLSGSNLLVLENPFQRFEHLTYMEISHCRTVVEFPDVSRAKNLRELRLDRCQKLVSIHKSVGRLANLVFLSATHCNQLQSFVPTIYLPSLEYLSFGYCSRLAHFPEIERTMDKPLRIQMLYTAIQELPESIKKLTGLNYLHIEGCKGLQHLPSSLFVLPNFVTLRIGGCYLLRESFRRFEGSHSACPKLETLHFGMADLSDEDIHAIIYNFPNLKHLDVSFNHFVSLPAHIKQSTKLTSLDVSYCDKLQEIPELPSTVQKVYASECNSLTPETSNILWSQVRKEIRGLEVRMPKREIPEWFDYVNEGGYPVFKARGKFPAVALAFVFGDVKALPYLSSMGVHLHLFIEGEHRLCDRFIVVKNQALLCDIRVLFSFEKWEDVGVGIGNDWKTIQVFCETGCNSLRSWGVYVYRHETNMEDIQFLSQHSISSLVRSLHEERKKSDQSLKGREMFHLQMRNNEEMFYCMHKQRRRELLLISEKTSRRAMAPREGEGSSGLNIDDKEDKEADSMLELLAEITSDDGEETQEAGPSSEQRYEGLLDEDSRSACRSGKKLRRC